MGPIPATGRILVTGTTGVLGRRAEPALRRAGFVGDVVPFDGDVSDRASTRRFLAGQAPFDAVLHLAAIVPVSMVAAAPFRAYAVNAIGTGILVGEVARTSPNAHVLYCSSSHVYRPIDGPIAEDGRTEPSNTYGRSKLAGEFIARDVAAESGLTLGIARVFSMYSVDQDEAFLYPAMRARIDLTAPGGELRIRGADNIRDFLSADAVIGHLVTLILCRAEGTINVGSGRGTSVLEFVRRMAGPTIRVVRDPDDESPSNALVADVDRLRRLVDG